MRRTMRSQCEACGGVIEPIDLDLRNPFVPCDAFIVCPHCSATVCVGTEEGEYISDPYGRGNWHPMRKRQPKQAEPQWSKADDFYQPLFEHMAQEHGLALIESELQEIMEVVKKMEGSGK